MSMFLRTKDVTVFCALIFLVLSHVSYGFFASSLKINSLHFRSPTNQVLLRQRTFPRHVLHLSDNSLSDQESDQINTKSDEIDIPIYVTAFAVLPILSFFTFDWLLSQITDFNLAPGDRQIWITA